MLKFLKRRFTRIKKQTGKTEEKSPRVDRKSVPDQKCAAAMKYHSCKHRAGYKRDDMNGKHSLVSGSVTSKSRDSKGGAMDRDCHGCGGVCQACRQGGALCKQSYDKGAHKITKVNHRVHTATNNGNIDVKRSDGLRMSPSQNGPVCTCVDVGPARVANGGSAVRNGGACVNNGMTQFGNGQENGKTLIANGGASLENGRTIKNNGVSCVGTGSPYVDNGRTCVDNFRGTTASQVDNGRDHKGQAWCQTGNGRNPIANDRSPISNGMNFIGNGRSCTVNTRGPEYIDNARRSVDKSRINVDSHDDNSMCSDAGVMECTCQEHIISQTNQVRPDQRSTGKTTPSNSRKASRSLSRSRDKSQVKVQKDASKGQGHKSKSALRSSGARTKKVIKVATNDNLYLYK